MGGYLSTGNVTGVSGEVIKTDVDSAEKVTDKVADVSEKGLKTDLNSGNSECVSADVSGKSLNSEPESKSEIIPESNPEFKPGTIPESNPETESKPETHQEPAKVVEIEPATVTQNTDVSKKSKRKNKHSKNQK